MICVLEAVEEIKEQYNAVNEEEGREPSLGLVTVTDGTARSIGQLFVCCLFLPRWSRFIIFSTMGILFYYYLIGGVETVLLYYKNLKISASSKFYTFYSQVSDEKLLRISPTYKMCMHNVQAIQKQSFAYIFQNRRSLKLGKFYKKIPVWNLFGVSNTVVSL